MVPLISLEKKSMQLVVSSLAIQTRKLQFIDKFFLVTKRESSDSMKMASSIARQKDDHPVAKIANQLLLNFSTQIFYIENKKICLKKFNINWFLILATG